VIRIKKKLDHLSASAELIEARWGLVPAWAKDVKIAYSTINARAETVAIKPAFRNAYRARRCLVPASGYYEWQARHDGKQLYYFTSRDGSLLAFAGLSRLNACVRSICGKYSSSQVLGP